MGKYAQARRRGRGVAATSAAATAPSVGDWTAEQSEAEGAVAIGRVAAIPAGADALATQYRQNGTADPFAAADFSALAMFDMHTGTDGTAMDVQVSWALAGIRVSPWSDTKIAITGPV